MREKTIEEKLVKITRSMGGLALKFSSPGFDGVPDPWYSFLKAESPLLR